MKIITTLFILFAYSFTVYAQKGIKYEIDRQTGDTLYSTKQKTLYVKPGAKNSVSDYIKSTVYKSKNGYMLGFEIQTGRTSVFSISKNAACEITLEDGTIIALNNTNGSQSKPSRLDYGAFLFVIYWLDLAKINQLKNAEISNISIQSSTGEMSYPIKEKMSGIIAEQIAAF